MKERQKKESRNGKVFLITIVAAVIIIAVIAFIVGGVKNNKEITVNIDEAVWMDVNQTLKVTDGSNKISFKVSTDQELVKSNENYEYEIKYVLTVNDVEYTGSHKFGNGYSVHNENNGIPYNIDIMDFEDNKIQVSFSVATPVTEQENI